MAQFDYTKTQSTVVKLLQKFGFTGEVINFSDTIDIVEGSTSLVYQSTVAEMVALPSSGSLINLDEKFREALLQGRAKVFVIAAKGMTFTPKVGDIIQHENLSWEIGAGVGKGGLMPLNPSGTPVLYIAGCMVGGRDLAANALSFTAISNFEDLLGTLMNTTLPTTLNG